MNVNKKMDFKIGNQHLEEDKLKQVTGGKNEMMGFGMGGGFWPGKVSNVGLKSTHYKKR